MKTTKQNFAQAPERLTKEQVKARKEELKAARKKAREEFLARLYPHKQAGIHIRSVKGNRAPKGLDKSCYGPQTKSLDWEVWRDGKRICVCETQSAAKDAAEMIRRGAKIKPSVRCVADGVSFAQLGRLATKE